MKKGLCLNMFFLCVLFFAFNNYVFAEDTNIDFKYYLKSSSDGKDVYQNDIITVKAVISPQENESDSHMDNITRSIAGGKVTLNYNADVLELQKYSDGNYYSISETNYNGISVTQGSNTSGSISFDFNIPKNAFSISEYQIGSEYTLVEFKFKVKYTDTVRQTIISMDNENDKIKCWMSDVYDSSSTANCHQKLGNHAGATRFIVKPNKLISDDNFIIFLKNSKNYIATISPNYSNIGENGEWFNPVYQYVEMELPSSNTNIYNVNNDVDEFEIVFNCLESDCKITGENSKKLTDGLNTLEITATSSSGLIEKKTISVNRISNSLASENKLNLICFNEIDNEKSCLGFNKNNDTFSFNTIIEKDFSNDTKSVNVSIKCYKNNCTDNENSLIELNDGVNTKEITVVGNSTNNIMLKFTKNQLVENGEQNINPNADMETKNPKTGEIAVGIFVIAILAFGGSYLLIRNKNKLFF